MAPEQDKDGQAPIVSNVPEPLATNPADEPSQKAAPEGDVNLEWARRFTGHSDPDSHKIEDRPM